MSDFGAGPLLTQDLDFEITTTGDIAVSEGVRELEKDIAIQSLLKLGDSIGRRSTTQTRARIRSRVREILLNDPRIASVDSVTVEFLRDRETVRIVTDVIADESQQELVFEV